MSHHAPALADIRSDVSRRNRSPPPVGPPGSFAYRPTPRTGPEGKPAPDRGTCSQSGMGWRQIPGRSPDTPRPHHRCPDTNRENNPCKVEWPGSQHSGRLRPGHEMVRRHGTTHLLQSPATAPGRGACPVLQTESPGARGTNPMLRSEPLSMRRRTRPALPKAELLRPADATRPSFTERRGER